MMKIFKKILLLGFCILLIIVVLNYPKLNIIAGYAAKNTASSVFIGKRSLAFTTVNDNAFSPIDLAKSTVDDQQKSATSSVFNVLTRTAFYKEGLGAILAIDKGDAQITYNKPKRIQQKSSLPYPYGDAEPKDTVLSSIDYQKIGEALTELFNPINKTRAVLVLYKNQIIAEKYANGYDKTSKMLGWSMTKSITSTIYGILQHQNKLNVYDKAPVDAWKNDERKEITIHNLLQMNSGLEWVEDYNTISDVTKMLFLEKDMASVQTNKSFKSEPNTSWNYSSGTTNLLSKILRNYFNSHQEYLDFWYAALIDKIGMHSMLIETDMNGSYVGSSYAWATPRDWAKLGLLYLNSGNWNGDILFDKNWIRYATTPTPTSDGQYGAQIWLNKGNKYPNVPTTMFSFNGYQGQNVFILPDQEMVVVRMSLTENADINSFLSKIVSAVN